MIRDLDANFFNDKQTITADPTDANKVYAVWDRLLFPTSERASVISGLVTNAFRGPIWFNRSIDGGGSWEQPRQIYDPGQNDQTIANQIVVLPPHPKHADQPVRRVPRRQQGEDQGLEREGAALDERRGQLVGADPDRQAADDRDHRP